MAASILRLSKDSNLVTVRAGSSVAGEEAE